MTTLPKSAWEEHLVLLKDPESGVAEAFRSLRARLSRSMAAGKRRLMLISSWSGDGKSMVAANLAVVLAQLQLKVCLVDGDLRRPSLSWIFGCTQDLGLTDYLEGTCDLDEAFHETGYPGLSVVPCGFSEVNPGTLLGHSRIGTFFDSLTQFGAVVLDSPPLSACSDAMLLAPYIDAAILVVNPKSWDGDVEKRLRDQLKELDIEVLGVIVNGSEAAATKYGYGYGYGYGYAKGDKKSKA